MRPDRLFVPDKDPDYVYHWMNSTQGPQGDQNMFIAQFEGWEPAPVTGPTPTEVLSVNGQSVPNPGGGTYRRGDLVLYRMKREQWEKKIHAETEQNRARQESTLDTMVLQAHENAAAQLRARGQKRIPKSLVFREDVGDPV